ncbi:MAG: chemotaxis-specific protein-glutamate methyltransferase CheB [Planctomycetaceae bacterium]|nr:chemotaxis-specific protein-glutamate methyltransferase CheB [Planctomycetaceae bacterium]
MKIRVLVAEDSLTVRKRLVDVISTSPDIEVIGEAEDGKKAIELCKSLAPDVVTLDMVMPGMSGLAATEYIMAYCPTPILVVSSSENRGELFKTYDALSAGALDVLEKPTGLEAEGVWETALLSAIRTASKVRVITHPRAKLGTRVRPAPGPAPARPRQSCRLIAMGASTGGPGAMMKILRGLPPRFPLPILLVIHIGRQFASSLAEWLGSLSAIPVSYAADGDPLPAPGQTGVILAPPDRHLVVRQGRLRLTSDPERHSCRPSVDALFESVARELGPSAGGCLLTGMGRDGARGLLDIRSGGGPTIVQDEATSVVFGMPQEAIGLGAADRVLALDRIAPALAEWAAGASSEGRA